MTEHETTPVEAAAAPASLSRSTAGMVSAAKFSAAQATRLRQTPSWRVGLPLQRRSGGFTLAKQRDPESVRGFTLVELLVTMGVLVLLVFLFTQLLNSAATVTTLGHKQMDLDSQARQILDRMAVDFAQMVKRADVDYYLKSSSGSASDCGVCGAQTGNDQTAFYSTVTGYYSATPTPTPTYAGYNSPVSLVAYRINSDSASSSYNRMERMGKGLAWNGVSSSWTPVVFLPQTIGGPQPINGNWPAAVSSSAPDSSYEVFGPDVFRFEYYYLLKTGSLSAIPWDTSAGHTNVSGMRDVAAIVADIAVIDPKSKVLLMVSQMEQLAGTNGQSSPLIDFGAAGSPSCPSPQWQLPGQLLAQWRCALDLNTIGLPRPAISGIRVYERYFYLTH